MEKQENKNSLDVAKTQLEQILDQTKLNIQLDQVERLLKNNILTFDHDGEKYRVKKPTFGQKKETYNRRNKMLLEYMRDSQYMYEKDLRVVLKETRNIDIDEIDNQYLTLQQKKEDAQLELGKLLDQKADEKKLNIYREEISKIEQKQQLLSFEKAQYLEMSIENQVETEIYLYLAYLLTERLVEESGKEEQWVKVWKTYDDFLNSYEELIDKASYYATIVSQNEIR